MKNWKSEIKKLKEKRDELGITNYAIGKGCNLHPTNVKNMFELKNVPSLENYITIKNFINNYKK